MTRPIAISAGLAAGALALLVTLTLNPGVLQLDTSAPPPRTEAGTDLADQTAHEPSRVATAPRPAESNAPGRTPGKAVKKEGTVAGKKGTVVDAEERLAQAPVMLQEAPAAAAVPAVRHPTAGRTARHRDPAAGLQADAAAPAATDPALTGRDRFAPLTPNPVKLAVVEPVSTFSIDVDTSTYAFVRRSLNAGHLPPTDAVRIEEMINYFDYAYPLPEDRSEPFKPFVAVFPTPWNPHTRLLHIGIKGFDLAPERRPRANLVFLVDVSGSMQAPDKLPLLKNALRLLVNTLSPDDTVALVVYAGAAGTVLEPTPVSEKGRILAALERLAAGGSTAGGEGLRLAYALAESTFDPQGVNRVILATDGDFNVGIRDPAVLRDFVTRKRASRIYLSVLGFGQGNLNDALMQTLAQNGNGNAAYIDTLNEARKVLVDETAGTLFAIARDVKLQVEFNPARVAEYRLIGYETRLLRRQDFADDRVDAGEVGAGHSVTAIYEITAPDSPARLIGDLRYGDGGTAAGRNASAEAAFLKIRYKLPDEAASRLITAPVDERVVFSAHTAPGEARFAAAVAAFGQLLRGAPHLGDFTYDDVIALARGALGEDPFGYRTEFLNLVRLAKNAAAMGTR